MGVTLTLVVIGALVSSTAAGMMSATGARVTGSAASLVPDFDGDGYADLAISAPLEDIGTWRNAGSVNIIHGSADGLTAEGDRTISQYGAGIRDVPEPGDRFGMSLAAGDFNGDGATDLAVGAPLEDLRGVVNAGAVNVVYGSDDGLTAAGNQVWSQDGDVADELEPDDHFGWALMATDVDGDGFADLIASAPSEDVGAKVDAGALHVLFGSARGLTAERDQLWTQDTPGILERADGEEMFGRSLAAADFDADGFVDLAVAAPYEDYHHERDGLVHVIRGSARGPTAMGNAVWSQDSRGIEDEAYLREQFGQSLAADDFDGDGFGDLAVGVWFQDFCTICNEGAVNVIYGSAAGLTAAGDQFWTQDSPGLGDARPFERFGNALVAADFNGDGLAELAVSAPREEFTGDHVYVDRGTVTVIRGAADGLTASGSQVWMQDSPGIAESTGAGDLFGLSLGAADFDADGAADLVVGVRFEDGAAVDDGGANVIYGTAAGLASRGNQFWSQDSPGIVGQAEVGDLFGWSISSGGPASGTPGEGRPSYGD